MVETTLQKHFVFKTNSNEFPYFPIFYPFHLCMCAGFEIPHRITESSQELRILTAMLLDFSLTNGIAFSDFEVTNDENTSGFTSKHD